MTEVKKPDHGKRGHAKISPSGIKNNELCGEFQRQGWDQEPHPVTVEGTFLHEVMELHDGSNKAKKWPVMTKEQSRLVDMCCDYMHSLSTTGNKLVLEPELDIVPGVWGFLDRLQFSKDGTHVDMLDWKFGWHPVEDAETNLQGISYLIGVLKKYKKVQTATVHFCQPRIDYVTVGEFTRDDLPRLEARVMHILDNAGNKKYFYKEAVCQYCGNATCPIRQNAVLLIAEQYVTELPVPANVHSSQITKPEEMSKLLDLRTDVKNWIEAVTHHAKVLIEEESVDIPGYETFYKTGATKVLDVSLVFDIVSRDYGITADQFMELFKSVPLGDLKDLVASHAPKGKMGAWKKKLVEDLSECEAIQPGKESLTLKKLKVKS